MSHQSSSTGAMFTDAPILRALVAFTVPLFAGNLLQIVHGSVNSFWIGHYLGEAALTAASNVNAVLALLLSSIYGVALVATILVGQCLGARNVDRAKRVIGTSLSFFAILSLLVAFIGLAFARNLLQAMHTPADVIPLAVAYLRIVLLGIPFQFCSIFIAMTLRGAGDAKTPFLFQLLSVGLDFVLNPLLIFGIGGFAGYGIAGSATAMLIAQSTTMSALLVFLYRTNNFLVLRKGELHYLRIDRSILNALIGKGIPMGMQMIVVTLSMIVMFSFVNGFGTQTSAAYSACLQLWNYVQMPVMAVGLAVSAMVAQNIGAKRWDRVHRIAGVAVSCNLAVTGVLIAVIYLFDSHILAFFLPNRAQAIQVAGHINAIVVWTYLLFGVTYVLTSVMRAAGAVIAPLVILVAALLGARIGFTEMFVGRWGADAVWWSFAFGSCVAIVLSVAYFLSARWKNAPLMASIAKTAA